jgi:hypothetical protein
MLIAYPRFLEEPIAICRSDVASNFISKTQDYQAATFTTDNQVTDDGFIALTHCY